MFENLLTNIKTKTNKVSNTLSYENLRTKTTKLSENFDNFKYKLKSNKVSNFLTKHNGIDDDDGTNQSDYFSPRAYAKNCNIEENDLMWPILSDNANIIKVIPFEDIESLDIVERFIKVITVNDNASRRTDREEIRRRLAMGSESDDYYTPGDRPGRKPSLQARLQSGMNLQICFMNETVSDSDSPNSDNESTTITTPAVPNNNTKQISRAPPYHKPASVNNTRTVRQKTQLNGQRPLSLPISQPSPQKPLSEAVNEADFFARQARLQIEARMALAQAKEMAHMQMEVERQKQKKSPITEMVRCSLEKVGIQFPEERRRVSRQILTEMNVAQLQVIVNDLHTQIEGLNEGLVRFLMERDDLHMEQDSMLVDIEDLTRYLGAKEQSVKEQKLITTPQVVNNNIPLPSPLMAISSSMKPRLHRIASLVKK